MTLQISIAGCVVSSAGWIEGTALVRFTVTRNGGLLGVAPVASSGSALLDHAATAAVAHAYRSRRSRRRAPSASN